jgi:prevent-host-death family protein
MGKTVAATQFKAECLRLIDEMSRDHQSVTITKRGRPVATLTPIAPNANRSIIGAMAGSVAGYDDPFAPAVDPMEWNAMK